MRSHTPVLVALALLVSLAAIARRPATAGEHPWTDKRIYYIMEYQGRLQEKGFFVHRPGSYERQPCVVIEEEKYTYAAYDAQTPIRAVRIKTITAPSGQALQRHEESILGDLGYETVTVAAGEALFEGGGGYGAPVRIPVPPGVLFEVSGEWLAGQTLRAGNTVSVDLIDRVNRQVITEHVDLVERVSPASGSAPAVWLAEFNSPGRPPMLARFTSDGRLIRLESEGLVYQVVGREDYERGRMPPPPPAGQPDRTYEYAGQSLPAPGFAGPAIPIGATVPAWDNFAWLILQAAPPGDWNNAVFTSEYSQIAYNGVYTSITALRNAPRVDSSALFPMIVPPDVQPYLSSSDALPALQPVLIEAARSAVADADTRSGEPYVLRAVSYLAGWINENIAVRDWTGVVASPMDTLSARSGDSAAHAALFATMARSLGVPSRICQGFLALTGEARYHCWSEAWINGVWIPVDTTVSRVGLPAGYVMAERSGPDGRFTQDFAGFMRLPTLSLALTSGGRETPGGQLAELVVGDRRTYAHSEGDWLANLYWGFALRLPPSWTGSARLNSVELASPDQQASVRCEALAGDYRAGQSELDGNIASLRSSLSRFRLVDSRVVSFDAEGATPALFIDFTCVQNGANLRCRQYVLPRRQRAFRISFWAPSDRFTDYAAAFDSILASFEF